VKSLRLIAALAALGSALSLPTAAVADPSDTPECSPYTHFERGDFPAGATIDNPWLPLAPGYRYTFEGHANRGGGLLPHQVILTVTGLTKRINGVTTVVAWDQDVNEDVLSESELAFFAQDDDGNVWTLGEYPEEYEDGYFTGAPSTWISGVSGAIPGIAMPAHPRTGGRPYLQGKSLDVEFYDCGQVFSRVGDELVIDEWSPLDPDSGHQRKTYHRGVGNVSVAAVDDPEGETLTLATTEQLTRADLAKADAAALKLEHRAYRVNADYRTTPPAHHRRG